METLSRIVLLTHPKEYRRQKTGTGRLAILHLARCEILPGLAFDAHPRVRELLLDPANFPVLLYPGPTSTNVAGLAPDGPEGDGRPRGLGGRRLLVFLVDSTWACSRAVLRGSPGIAALPRLSLRPREKSRWRIKRQPREYFLSTIEAIHELLCALEEAGLDSYPDKVRLLRAFEAMQDYQIERARASLSPRIRPPRLGPIEIGDRG